jgi:hypothetical protein
MMGACGEFRMSVCRFGHSISGPESAIICLAPNPHGTLSMARLDRKLDLRTEADRYAMVDVLSELGIHLDSDVLRFASSKLPEDWLVAWPLNIFSIRTGRTGTFGIGVAMWAELVQSIYDMRAFPGIDEQIRRLSTLSHEALDTCLVLQVAGRYARQGLPVRFEPNGRGCSDLLIRKDGHRFYIEVKRENEQDHKRFMSIQRCSSEVLGQLDPQMRAWLEDRNLRLEVRFTRSFSSGSVVAITDEIVQQVPFCDVGKEGVLSTMRGASYVLLQRQQQPFFQKGIRKGIIRVKHPGTPVQLSPENMPVCVIFDWALNLGALKARIQKASRQLNNDTARDPGAPGFFVMQVSHGEAAKDAIISRYFSSLPPNCLGIVLLSDPSYLIPASGISSEATDAMAVAAKIPNFSANVSSE